MKIVEQSRDRLCFSFGPMPFNGTAFDFDRRSGRARIRRRVLFVPLPTLDFALDDIEGFRLDPVRLAYVNEPELFPVLALKSGKIFRLATGAESSSKWAAAAVSAFLREGSDG